MANDVVFDNNWNYEHLLKNVHLNLKAPTQSGKSFLVQGDYYYFHYGCDNTMDHGWGCAYRTLQTICTWISRKQQMKSTKVPSIFEIQSILADIECKPKNFVGSREWIGAMEVFYVLDKLFDAKCRILHKSEDCEFTKMDIEKLAKYFENFGGICMMGGNTDAASKGIAGIHLDSEHDAVYLLVIDPHFPRKPKSNTELIDAGYVSWQPITNFSKASFYNVCMPEIKTEEGNVKVADGSKDLANKCNIINFHWLTKSFNG